MGENCAWYLVMGESGRSYDDNSGKWVCSFGPTGVSGEVVNPTTRTTVYLNGQLRRELSGMLPPTTVRRHCAMGAKWESSKLHVGESQVNEDDYGNDIEQLFLRPYHFPFFLFCLDCRFQVGSKVDFQFLTRPVTPFWCECSSEQGERSHPTTFCLGMSCCRFCFSGRALVDEGRGESYTPGKRAPDSGKGFLIRTCPTLGHPWSGLVKASYSSSPPGR